MDYHQSPKSNNRILRKIELPDVVKTFFEKRGKFIQGLPGYEQIEGASPGSLDECFYKTGGFDVPKKETHLIDNTTQRAYQNAQDKTRELLRLFFKAPISEIAEPMREYMLTGGTKPIRVTTHINGNRGIVFAKRPSVERLVGLSLYNLIGENKPIDFLFSEYIFVEDAVAGSHINSTNIRYFKQLPKLPESIVRLSVQDRFIGIQDLNKVVDLPDRPQELVNLLVQQDGIVMAFDIDCAFTERYPNYDLVETMRKRGIFISRSLEEEVKRDEARRIKQVIIGKNKKAFQNIIELMDKTKPLVVQFKEIGHHSAREYFEERELWLNSLAK